MIKLSNSPAIGAGSLIKSKPKDCSTRFLSSKPKEFFDRFNLLLEEKRAGNIRTMIDEGISAKVDKVLEHKCIFTKEHRFSENKSLH